MRPIMTMREALESPDILGTDGPADTWLVWNVLLIASEGEPLTPKERAVFKQVKPTTGAEAMLEFYRRQCVAAGLSFNRHGVDMDGVRTPGPEFGWNMASAPVVRVVVPPQLRGEMIGGRCPCRIGDQLVLEATRSEAAGWLGNSVWRSLKSLPVIYLGKPHDIGQ